MFGRLLLSLSILIASSAAFAQADLCGDPPPFANDSLKGDIEGEALFLSRFLDEASLSGQIQTSRTEVVSKYPKAELSRSNAYFEYQVCILLAARRKLNGPAKDRGIDEDQARIRKASPY